MPACVSASWPMGGGSRAEQPAEAGPNFAAVCPTRCGQQRLEIDAAAGGSQAPRGFRRRDLDRRTALAADIAICWRPAKRAARAAGRGTARGEEPHRAGSFHPPLARAITLVESRTVLSCESSWSCSFGSSSGLRAPRLPPAQRDALAGGFQSRHPRAGRCRRPAEHAPRLLAGEFPTGITPRVALARGHLAPARLPRDCSGWKCSRHGARGAGACSARAASELMGWSPGARDDVLWKPASGGAAADVHGRRVCSRARRATWRSVTIWIARSTAPPRRSQRRCVPSGSHRWRRRRRSAVDRLQQRPCSIEAAAAPAGRVEAAAIPGAAIFTTRTVAARWLQRHTPQASTRNPPCAPTSSRAAAGSIWGIIAAASHASSRWFIGPATRR